MNPRQKIIAGYITDFFMDNKAPTWQIVGSALKKFDIKNLYGGEILPEDFLKILFADDETLLKQIPEFGFRHHQIVMILMKEEFSLTCCTECGHYNRSIGFNWRRRFQSFSELDDWVIVPKQETNDDPDVIVLDKIPEQEDQERNDMQPAEKDNDEEKSKVTKCCKYFNPNF